MEAAGGEGEEKKTEQKGSEKKKKRQNREGGGLNGSKRWMQYLCGEIERAKEKENGGVCRKQIMMIIL